MPTLSRRWILLVRSGLLFGLGACTQSAADPAFSVAVVDDRGEALAEVALRADTELLVRSDSDGRATLRWAALRPHARLTAQCPEAYRPATPVRIAPADALPRLLQFVCRPRLRTLAVVAYAPGAAGAVLRADTQALGRVGADGTLHTVLRRPPGAALTLTLESEPRLTRALRVRDRDEIILLDAAR